MLYPTRNCIRRNAKNECAAWSVSENADAAEAGESTFAGYCFGLDPEGDAYWFWWRLEATGTDQCPALCGSWGVYRGTGKYERIGGGGTWAAVTLFQDGSNRGVFTYKGM